MFKSIRWRLSGLYFILVFIAMTIVGVSVSDRLEDYNLGLVRENLELISSSTVLSIIPEDPPSYDDIQQSIEKIALPVGYNVYLIDAQSYKIIAATNSSYVGKSAMSVLDNRALMMTINEKTVNMDVRDQGGGLNMSKIYTNVIKDKDGAERYIIYSTASLSSVYRSLRATTMIILYASGIALVVSLIVGYIMSGSITTPINDLNTKASMIAKGDFSQRVQTKSNDEIGMLGNTFNYLAKRLDHTLIEMSTEKSKLDAIINNMADGLMAIDEQGFVVLYNKSLIKLLQTKGIVLYGNNLTDLARELSLDLKLSDIKRSLAEQDVGTFIIETDDQKVLKVSCAYFSDDARRQNGFILLFQDITEAKQLDDLRKEFVANVSHELKTPITTIKTYAETLASGAVDDPATAQNFFETIEKEADRMTALVRDLLQLSHIDFKKTKWEMDEYDLSSIIKECIEHLKIFYIEKKQDIRFVAKEKAIVYVDKTKIKQVFVNIISNAIKYTPDDGEIRIDLRCSGNSVQVHIIDNGIGIPAQDVERVFERFYRVDKGRSRQQGGTGLGLSIAQDIIRAHDGEITARSEVGKGSEFIVKLPLKKG
ncbi:MAG: ATP-binding protein [Peptostreptococcaceae bacterium]|nr:ATP-binding protein [Peptostreptococcaceae bacterium]